MKKRDHILAIDAGTQSLRAMVFDVEGMLIARVQTPFEPPDAPKQGWAEQSVASFWYALCLACNELWQHPEVDRNRLAGMTVTSQRGSLILLGKNGQPLRPAILWMDQRRASSVPNIGPGWNLLFRTLGLRHTLHDLLTKAQSNWIRQHQPEIWAETWKVMLVSGYLNFMLTGQPIDSLASQVAYLPFDYKKQKWSGPRDWKWRALGIHPDQLTGIVPPGSSIGLVTGTASQATGIPEGLPVVAAAADKACEALGSGCLTPNLGHLSFGTAATFNVTSPRYFETEPFIPPYPAGIPNHYSVEIQLFRGFWLVSWFLRQFGHVERQKALETGMAAETFLDELLAITEPGCQGLLLHPSWAPGIKTPGPEARGAMIGFRACHGRAHMYRAIIEGLMYGLLAAQERVAKRGKLTIDRIRCSGGGSQSDRVMQIAADVFGLPTERPHTFEASGLGAAIIASAGLGLHSGFEEAIEKMTKTGQTYHPNQTTHETYRQVYGKAFKPLYRKLKPIFAGLAGLV